MRPPGAHTHPDSTATKLTNHRCARLVEPVNPPGAFSSISRTASILPSPMGDGHASGAAAPGYSDLKFLNVTSRTSLTERPGPIVRVGGFGQTDGDCPE
jgi:hypothetical protein